MENYYLVDYENVGSNGIKDCSNLLKTDHIHIFYTENSKNITLDIINNHGLSELETHKVPAGKESLDKHLGSYLGFLIGIHPSKDIKVFIISKDKGYEDLIRFWGNAADIVRKDRIEITKPKKLPDVKNRSACKTKQTTETANSKPTRNPEERTRLNSEIQKKLSELDYLSGDITKITKMVLRCHGTENFKRDVHLVLQKEYENFSEIYNDIKPVLNKYN